MHLREIWQRITTTRYALSLEAFARAERALNEEIARLRAENRALLNSILGIAGIPPILVSPAEPATEAAMLNTFLRASTAPRSAGVSPTNLSSSDGNENHRLQAVAANSAPPRPDKPESTAPTRARLSASSAAPRRSGQPRPGRFNGQPQQNISPMRRRSWQQINRMLEFESARKKPQET
jgi:hypothetical protein